MAVLSYAEKFERDLQTKYRREQTSDSLFRSNPNVKFINAQTIKLPSVTVSGYKDHNRENIGFNSGTITNEWEPKKLEHDRDIEFAIDPMDIDETNLTVEMANITNTFEEDQAIPEVDAYTYSKLYAEAVKNTSNKAIVTTDVLTKANILEWFDTQMSKMDDEGVPAEGREMRLTSEMYKLFKEAEGISRNIDISKKGGNDVNRNIHSIDDVKIITVPSARFMTKYNFTNGFVADAEAKQINIMLCHPSCQVSRQKYAYIKVFTPGTDSRTADKYIYQNRKYWDSFLLKQKACGIAFNVAQ